MPTWAADDSPVWRCTLQLKKDEPGLSFGEVGKRLGEMWKAADEKTKKVGAPFCGS